MSTETTAQEPAAIDEEELNAFLGQLLGELGATVNAGLVVIGDRLGLYRAMAGAGAISSSELAERTGTSERYVREWLNAQAAGGYVSYDPATRRYTLPAEHAMVLADENSPAFAGGWFQLATASLRSEPEIRQAFRSGAGFGWHEHNAGVHEGCARFFGPTYAASVVSTWLPALDGVVAKLEAGAEVADVGCGLGRTTLLMAQAYPRSRFTGFDYHQGSLDLAREQAAENGLGDRVRFETIPAKGLPGAASYDLVTMFDCLHDMGDPVGAGRRVHEALKPDGTWMVVEPLAGDRVEENLNPIGRAYYGFSSFLCVPSSLAQEEGLALGAQAGEARIRDVATAAGFTRFRRTAEGMIHHVYEIRP